MSNRNRHPARCVALQALYELDLTEHTIATVMTERLGESPLSDDLRLYAYQLVNGVTAVRDKMDMLIQRYAPDYPISQVAVVDRNILRMALYELAHNDETPVKVAINEAIELAKEFGSENAFRFVNGVLGALAQHENNLRTALEGDASNGEP